MNVAKIVKTARETRGLSIGQLADKSGISLSTLYYIESGRVSPRMDTMLQIMRVLDYDIIFNPRYKGGYSDER